MNHKVLPLLQDMLSDSALWTHSNIPFQVELTPGVANVAVVTGDNCSGKSFLVESLRSWVSGEKLDSIVVSIRERSGGGLYDMAGMRRAMMFGDETDQSTGAVSAGVVERAFNTLTGRAASGVSSMLVLDEPELGMSESMSGALGEMLGESALAMAEKAVGLVVVTHSRTLVARMRERMGAAPTCAHLRQRTSAKPGLSLDQWIRYADHATLDDLKQLGESNSKNRRIVEDILKELRARKSADES